MKYPHKYVTPWEYIRGPYNGSVVFPSLLVVDPLCRNEKEAKKHEIIVPNVYVRIYPSGDVLYSIRYVRIYPSGDVLYSIRYVRIYPSGDVLYSIRYVRIYPNGDVLYSTVLGRSGSIPVGMNSTVLL